MTTFALILILIILGGSVWFFSSMAKKKEAERREKSSPPEKADAKQEKEESKQKKGGWALFWGKVTSWKVSDFLAAMIGSLLVVSLIYWLFPEYVKNVWEKYPYVFAAAIACLVVLTLKSDPKAALTRSKKIAMPVFIGLLAIFVLWPFAKDQWYQHFGKSKPAKTTAAKATPAYTPVNLGVFDEDYGVKVCPRNGSFTKTPLLQATKNGTDLPLIWTQAPKSEPFLKSINNTPGPVKFTLLIPAGMSKSDFRIFEVCRYGEQKEI